MKFHCYLSAHDENPVLSNNGDLHMESFDALVVEVNNLAHEDEEEPRLQAKIYLRGKLLAHSSNQL